MSQIGNRFFNLFDPARGDLISGISEQRERYAGQAPRIQKKAMESAYWMIDHFNDLAGISITSFNYDDWRDKDPRYVQECRERLEELNRLGKLGPRGDEVLDYFDALVASRFSPARIRDMAKDELIRKAAPKQSLAEKEGFSIFHKSTRLACKFGIEWVVEHSPVKGRLVHFILDGLGNNIIKISSLPQSPITKTTRSQQLSYQGPHVPITTSELLSVYRNWGRYEGKVLFYENFVCVQPPWEADSLSLPSRATWDCYAKSRLAKYKNQLNDSSELPHAKTYQSEIAELQEGAQQAEAKGQHVEAANLLKDARDLARRGPASQVLTHYRRDLVIQAQNNDTALGQAVRRALAKYTDRNLGVRIFQWRSEESKNALTHLEALVDQRNDRNLREAIEHYLGSSSNVKTTRQWGDILDKSSSMYEFLNAEYALFKVRDLYNY